MEIPSGPDPHPPIPSPRLSAPAALPSTVRRGWAPAPVRRLPAPPALAELFGGGVPRGRVSEVVGPLGSGRTSLAYALLAASTAAREVVAVVDVADVFDPASARRAAVDLDAVLWVRPPSVGDALRSTELILAAGGFALVLLDLDGVSLRHVRLHSWPRLARAAERSGTALLVLAPHRVAGSFATLSVTTARRSVSFGALPGSPKSRGGRGEGGGQMMFDGFESRAVLVRNKLGPSGMSRLLRWDLAADYPLTAISHTP